jgi:hypothetical protein
MFSRYLLSTVFLLPVVVGCGDDAVTTTPAAGGAAPAEAPIEPVKSADDPSAP